MATSFTYEWTNGSNSNYGIRFTISQTNNESNNTSTIAITGLQIKGPGITIILDGELWINGQKAWEADMGRGTHVQWVSGWTTEDVGSYNTITIPHNADGSITITLTLKPHDYSQFFICNSNGSALSGFGTGSNSISKTGTANNVGKVRIYTSSGWVSATPYVYTSSGWKKAIPYVYTSSGWTKAK